MKAAACGTWLGDLITALMVTDMMLQDNLYPSYIQEDGTLQGAFLILRSIWATVAAMEDSNNKDK
jgi:hypothetical protein